MKTRIWWEMLKEKYYYEDSGTDERKVLKMDFGEIGWQEDALNSDSCEHSNQTLN
jgi:hypothetical protein